MHSLGKGNLQQILLLEQKYHVSMPESLQKFLLTSNGTTWEEGFCVPIPGTSQTIWVDAIYGINVPNKWIDMNYWMDRYGEELPGGTVIFGSDTLEGFLLLLNTPEASGVYYWDDKYNLQESSTDANCYYLCSSFQEFERTYIKED